MEAPGFNPASDLYPQTSSRRWFEAQVEGKRLEVRCPVTFLGTLSLNWHPPVSPISRLSAPMRNGYNPNSGLLQEINKNVGEAPDQDSSVIQPIFGPSFRRSGDALDRPFYLLFKTLAKMLTTSCIPFQRRGVLLRRLGMENHIIAFHGLSLRPAFLPLTREQA